jgi:hypothetical protein
VNKPLYELTGAYAELQARAEDGDDVCAALAELDDAIEVKAERVAAVLRGLTADQDVLKVEEKRLAARRKAVEANEERLRAYIRDCMVSAGIKRIKCTAFTLSISEREQLVVSDEALVPAEFKRVVTETKVDRAALGEAYKRDGELVPGTDVQTLHVLTVR